MRLLKQLKFEEQGSEKKGTCQRKSSRYLHWGFLESLADYCVYIRHDFMMSGREWLLGFVTGQCDSQDFTLQGDLRVQLARLKLWNSPETAERPCFINSKAYSRANLIKSKYKSQ